MSRKNKFFSINFSHVFQKQKLQKKLNRKVKEEEKQQNNYLYNK